MREIVAPLLNWYRENKRDLPWRKDTQPYHIWISEIMLQQTRVEAVKEYYLRFLECFPDVASLAAAPEDMVLKQWEGLGYYSRARNLQKAARQIVAEYNGVFPSEYAAIRKLPGIGEYTAGAISSIAFHEPTPAVDGNVLRVISRVTQESRCIDLPAVKKEFFAKLAEIYPADHCGDFTQSLMELGAVVCVPNGAPKCAECPLRYICNAYQTDTIPLYPVRSKKQPRKIEEKTVLLLCYGEKIAIRKRTQSGLLKGMWELPNICGTPDPEELRTILQKEKIIPASMGLLGRQKHVFTHIEWHMTAYRVACKSISENFCWVTPEQLSAEYALPSAFAKFIK